MQEILVQIIGADLIGEAAKGASPRAGASAKKEQQRIGSKNTYSCDRKFNRLITKAPTEIIFAVM